jgi:phosphoglucosamine mutase
MAVQVGRALGGELRDRSADAASGMPRIVVAKDTRISGDMLAHAIAAGVCSSGAEACLAGVLPTPGLAFLTKARGFDAGVMISASHNPFHDNGIKIFRGDGFKLSDAMEDDLERRIFESRDDESPDNGGGIGQVSRCDGGEAQYRGFLVRQGGEPGLLDGLKVALDCGNGATFQVAPGVFTRLGAHVGSICVEPDGTNINAHCGSEHRQRLAEMVVEGNFDVGFAFDGDGDRVIAVDEEGRTVAGDRMLAICAKDMKERGELSGNLVVSTVMSNVGLGIALKDLGIVHVTTQVGDRYVLQEMVARNGAIGGEDSGHMIFLKEHTTGDGVLAALKIAQIMRHTQAPLSALASVMDVYPQRLINVTVEQKRPIEDLPRIVSKVEEVERRLGDRGRVLIRYSGTQPMCRVMVEGPTEVEVEKSCQEIAAVVKSQLSGK